MAEKLDYIDLPGIGAARGVLDYYFDQSDRNLGYAFIYGRDDTELSEQMEQRKKRVDFARRHRGDWIHPDGFPMAPREIVVSVDKQPQVPMRIVGVEIYPPFEVPEVQQKALVDLASSMEAAHTRDLDKIQSTLSALGMSDQLVRQVSS